MMSKILRKNAATGHDFASTFPPIVLMIDRVNGAEKGGISMRIGVPKEIKNHEYRVGLTPDSVREMVAHGHEVLIETMAGEGMGSPDADYEAAGAKIVGAAADVFERAEMVIKVKEPQAVERKMLREGQILFTLSAPRTRSRADQGPRRQRCGVYRL